VTTSGRCLTVMEILMPFGVCAVYRWIFDDIMAMRDARCCVGGSWAMDHRSQVLCIALDLDLS
jgi:hypothetical protein